MVLLNEGLIHPAAEQEWKLNRGLENSKGAGVVWVNAVPDSTANPLELGGGKGRNGPAKGELAVQVKGWSAELNQP